MRVWVGGVGVMGPGLPNWALGAEVLAGRQAWNGVFEPPPPSALLAPNERRRTGQPVRLALGVSEPAVRMAGLAPDAVRGVFGSANGEADIVNALLHTLASPDPQLSPTQFHNSVHNAVAGYWAMGAKSHQPMTCLGAHDFTAGAALLKAVSEVVAEQAPVLLCVYDAPMPQPLARARPTEKAFAAALVLLPSAGGIASLDLTLTKGPPDAALQTPEDLALHPLYSANPAARMLRVLEILARGKPGRAELSLFDGIIHVDIVPC